MRRYPLFNIVLVAILAYFYVDSFQAYAQFSISENRLTTFPAKTNQGFAENFIKNYVKDKKLLVDKDTLKTRLFGVVDSLILQGEFHELLSLYQYFEAFLVEWEGAANEAHVKATFYNNLAIPYFCMGNYEYAIKFFYKSLSISEKTKGEELIRGKTYANLGLIFLQTGNAPKADHYLQQAEKIAVKGQSWKLLSGILISQGILACESDNNLVKGLAYYSKAQTLGKQYGYKDAFITATRNIANIYIELQQPRKALNILLKAIKDEEKENRKLFINDIGILRILGKSYLQLKDYSNAEKYLTIAMNIAQKQNSKNELKGIYESFYNLYRTQANYKAALQYHEKYYELMDELLNADNMKTINNMEFKYRTAQKDKEIAENKLKITQQQKNLGQKNFWMTLIITASLIILLSGILLYRNLKHRQHNQQNQIRLLQQEKEIGQLSAMMKGEEKERSRIAYELHDGIGGMLAAIKMNFAAVKERYQQQYNLMELTPIMHMVEDTTDEVRKTAHNLMPGILLKHNLTEALQIYCSSLKASGSLRISLNIYPLPNDLPKGFELMLYRTLQELLQNIIKHALATEAVIELEHRKGKINIIIEDNGQGFDVEESRPGGFGLQNLRYRVQALQGTIRIESAKGKGTTISITFDQDKINKSFDE